MKQNRHHFFLGSFVLAAVFILGASVTVLGANTLWEEYLMIETYIEESVHGLETGSPVAFKGMSVGKVQRITPVFQIYPTQKRYAYVLVKIFLKNLPNPQGASLDQSIEDRVAKGLRFSLASAGITGGSYIETDYIDDPASAPVIAIDWTPTEIYVPSVPSTLFRFERSLDTVLDHLAKTDIQGVVAAARDTLRVFEKSMTDMDLSGLSKSTQSLLKKAEVTVEGAGADLDRLTKEINTTLVQIRTQFGDTLKGADRTVATLDEVLESGQLRKSFERLSTVLENADAAMKEIRALATRTDRTIAGVEQIVRGRSREAEIAISNLREILENLNSLTGTLEEYPSLLFLGKAPKGSTKLKVKK